MAFLSSIFGKKFDTVSPAVARARIASGANFIDVRTKAEFSRGHATGARNIPLDTLEANVSRLNADTEVVIICHTGMRSASAARTLMGLGYRVANVRGGTIAWDRS
ncbi:rhodanese-like domain-containing protein [Salinibacterium sp. PAMC 21357]|uniref:rhodanese-like domain-containing protein n=1 Tax=Salinibacterium sp. PAMC 21357 TaxID=1112215 RepID=UPI0002893F5F|nr:rhodanese-like domain-containing protein [Salinibacterium sp. PAMC 21357]